MDLNETRIVVISIHCHACLRERCQECGKCHNSACAQNKGCAQFEGCLYE